MPTNVVCTLVWPVPTKAGAVLIGDLPSGNCAYRKRFPRVMGLVSFADMACSYRFSQQVTKIATPFLRIWFVG